MVELADHLGVPVVAVVGESFDDVGARVPVVSLVEQHGRQLAMSATQRCLRDAAQAVLDAARRSR